MTASDCHIDLSLLSREPAGVYHARAGECLSSHLLADFRKSPLLYFKRRLGLIPEEDRPAYLVGEAAHVRILEGRQEYNRRFAIGGPINPTTGKPFGANTKAFAEWALQQGKPVLAIDQTELIENMAVGVSMHEAAVDLIIDGIAEGVARGNYCGMPCQIRIDWLNPHRGIVDLKTCDDLTYFEADARRYGYGHQLAFYRAVLAQVVGQLVLCHFIVVEKREPFRCGVWRVCEDTLDQCALENAAAIERLKECDRLNQWPTGYEATRLFQLN